MRFESILTASLSVPEASHVLDVDANVTDAQDDHRAEQENMDLVESQEQETRTGRTARGSGTGPRLR